MRQKRFLFFYDRRAVKKRIKAYPPTWVWVSQRRLAVYQQEKFNHKIKRQLFGLQASEGENHNCLSIRYMHIRYIPFW